MIAFRQLLRPDTAFQWNDELENAFQESKKVIAKEIEEGIAIFNLLGNRLVQIRDRLLAPTKNCSCKNLEPFCCKTG